MKVHETRSSGVPWRPSTREEIIQYYEEEFPRYIEKIPNWITPNSPHEFAVAFRKRYTAIRNSDGSSGLPAKDFIRRYTRDKNTGRHTFGTWGELLDLIRDPGGNDPQRGNHGGIALADPAVVDEQRPVPSAVYYSLENHDTFWVLAFDIDAKDVAKMRANQGEIPDLTEDVGDERLIRSGVFSSEPNIGEYRHILEDDQSGPKPSPNSETQNMGEYHAVSDVPDHEYTYGYRDIRAAVEKGFDLKDWLEDVVGFREVRVFYSGQGVHIYAFGDEKHYNLTHQSRKFLTTYIQDKLRIPVDEEVTWRKNGLMRLPYSLHTDVSRIVVEIEGRDFDFKSNPVPDFINEGNHVSE